MVDIKKRYVEGHGIRQKDDGTFALRDADNDPDNGVQPTDAAVRDFIQLDLSDKRSLLGQMENSSSVGMKRALLSRRGPAAEQAARRSIESRNLADHLLFYRDLKGFAYLMKTHIVDFDRAERWPRDALEDSISTMIEALDNGMLPVVFQSELEALSKDAGAKAFLGELNAKLLVAAAPAGSETPSVDLWALALEYTGNDEAKATMWLAVLFQDLRSNVHTGWLDDRSFAVELSSAIELLRATPAGRLELFPPDVEDPRAVSRIYHYYVPRYLAAKMVSEGTPSDLAFLATLMMTVEYEFASILARDMVASGKHAGRGRSSAARWEHLFRTYAGLDRPVAMLAGDHHEDLEDIHLGYLGSLAGSGLDLEPDSFSEHRRALLEDPHGAIHRIFERAASLEPSRARR